MLGNWGVHDNFVYIFNLGGGEQSQMHYNICVVVKSSKPWEIANSARVWPGERVSKREKDKVRSSRQRSSKIAPFWNIGPHIMYYLKKKKYDFQDISLRMLAFRRSRHYNFYFFKEWTSKQINKGEIPF